MKQQVMASKRSEEVGKEDDEACAASCLTGETLVGRLKRNRRKPKCGDPMLSSIAIPEKKIRVRFSMLKKQQQLGLLLLNQEHICDEHSLDYHSNQSGIEAHSDSPKQGNTVNNTGSNTNEDHDDRENPGENRDVVDDDGEEVMEASDGDGECEGPVDTTNINTTTTKTYATGPWSDRERELFLQGYKEYGSTSYAAIQAIVGTRSVVQCQSHAQSWRKQEPVRWCVLWLHFFL